jgi:two-component sensor histidine kinase
MLYLFTKQKAYLYYVFYMFSLIFFQSYYLGVSQLYIFSHAMSVIVAKASLIYISVFILSILLFTREFLNIKRFKKIDAIFRFYFYTTPFVALLGYNNFCYNLNAIAFFIPLGLVVIFTGFYALFHGVKEAKFYVIGWSFVAISLLFTNLKTLGFFDIDIYFAYINELAFTLEAFLFSIALAHKIKILTQEKKESDRKLNEELNALVEERTRDLNIALASQELLYKELNHRVKNNLQMVASLIKLQMSSSHSTETKNALQTTYNRIHSIAELYEILNVQKLHASKDVEEYFRTIVNNIKNNFTKEVSVAYEIECSVALEKVVYLGLILNELVTNSFKHAFHEAGFMKIRFVDEGGSYLFSVQDSGEAREEDFQKNGSLGLMIVKTLVEKQLFATMHIDVTKGTKISIEWNKNAK